MICSAREDTTIELNKTYRSYRFNRSYKSYRTYRLYPIGPIARIMPDAEAIIKEKFAQVYDY